MSDAPQPDRPRITEIEDDRSSSIFDSDIGDDWGEAFEADDFALAPDDEAGNEFFLEGDDEDASVSEETSDSGDTKAETESTPKKTGLALPPFIAPLLSKVQSLTRLGKERFLSLPTLYKIPILITFCLSLLSLYFFSKAPSQPPPVPTDIPVQVAQIEEPVQQSPERIAALDALITAETPKEKIRKKWHFPSFLISTNDEMKGDNFFFVEVDITFILLLDEDEDLPVEQSIYVRDMIYQFYNNRPLYELRRYSLARGEMNRKLRSWVEKQWPEGQIATIVFNRYQVL